MNYIDKQTSRSQAGFTLIELMITIAIIGILAAVAIPSYNSYIETSKHGVARANAESLAGFVRTYYYEFNTHPTGVYNPSAGTDTMPAALDWSPDGDGDQFSYTIAACSGSTAAECVDITVAYTDGSGVSQTVTISP